VPFRQLNKTLAAENPGVVFGMWPPEFHPDPSGGWEPSVERLVAERDEICILFLRNPEAGEMTPQH
jgi:hypothetical protein